MDDRAKVIKAIDICLGHGKCDDCGYRIKGGYSTMDCRKPMMRDALALLKEQEAVEPYQFEDIWKCGNCGDGVVAYEELGVSGIEEVKFDYCPTCGRRVLWEGR